MPDEHTDVRSLAGTSASAPAHASISGAPLRLPASSEPAAPSVHPWVPMFVDDRGVCRPAPLLLSAAEVMALLRFGDTGIRFPKASLNRYRRNGLPSVRVGKRVWFLLPDVLTFLRSQQ